ncbi:MAG: hypothetical protein KAX49_17960 [Halanaerobiales bacterium]|nr:hypothetical protein [Halanaerobiales bacterium]
MINVNLENDIVEKVTIDIMNISYLKGGDYSNQVIRSFAETYIQQEFYKKFVDM